MDYGNMLNESFSYVREGISENAGTWILLIVLTVLPVIPVFIWLLFMIPSLITGMPDFDTLIGGFILAVILAVLLGAFYNGYMLKILRGDKPLPPVADYGTLFSDGIKYLIITIIYLIPVIIVLLITVGATLAAIMPSVMSGDFSSVTGLAVGSFFVGIFISLILAVLLSLLAIIGIVRFARTGAVAEAFNFSAILATIGKLGWIRYVFALVIVVVLVVIFVILLSVIPYVGGLIQFVLSPFISVFCRRYVCLLYDSADVV